MDGETTTASSTSLFLEIFRHPPSRHHAAPPSKVHLSLSLSHVKVDFLLLSRLEVAYTQEIAAPIPFFDLYVQEITYVCYGCGIFKVLNQKLLETNFLE